MLKKIPNYFASNYHSITPKHYFVNGSNNLFKGKI